MNQSFGNHTHGRGLFGGTEYIPEETTGRISQRLPTGSAFKGKYLNAILTAAEKEFNAFYAAAQNSINLGFWESYSVKTTASLSLPYIESLLHSGGFPNVALYHSNAQRVYTSPLPPRLTYYGHGTHGEGDHPQNITGFRAQHGENFSHNDPRNYPAGDFKNIGTIEHLLDEYNTNSERTQSVFNSISNSLSEHLFTYYACDKSGGFMEEAITATQQEREAIKRILLQNAAFGLFGILLFK